MICMATVSLLWFGRSPSLLPRCEKASLRVSNDRLTSLMNMDSPEVDNNRMCMEYWHLWKASDMFCWRQNFWKSVLFSVSFFASSWSLLFSSISKVKEFPYHNSSSTQNSYHFKETSVWYLDHYHWASSLQIRLISVLRVGCFSDPYL